MSRSKAQIRRRFCALVRYANRCTKIGGLPGGGWFDHWLANLRALAGNDGTEVRMMANGDIYVWKPAARHAWREPSPPGNTER